MEIAWTDFLVRSEQLYGKDPTDHQYKCPACGRVQSIKSLREQKKSGILSERYGTLTAETCQWFFCECLSPTCNWVAYGLFNSGIIIIEDPSKPHNINTKENCGFTFPLAHDEEMCKVAGVLPEPLSTLTNCTQSGVVKVTTGDKSHPEPVEVMEEKQ